MMNCDVFLGFCSYGGGRVMGSDELRSWTKGTSGVYDPPAFRFACRVPPFASQKGEVRFLATLGMTLWGARKDGVLDVKFGSAVLED